MNFFVLGLLFSVFSTLTGLGICLIQGKLTTFGAQAGLVVGVISTLVAFRKISFPKKLLTWDVPTQLMFFIFFLFCYRQFGWLLFFKEGSYWTLNENNYGDLPFHLSIIANFAGGAAFWPENPFYIGERFYYSIGVDLFSAMFVKLGMPTDSVLVLQGLVLGLITGIGLLIWSGWFGLGAFLFSGGAAGFEIVRSGIFKDYQYQLAWKNLALTLLVPQRSFLIGFPLGLFLLWCWRQRFLLRKPSLPFWFEGLLWGALPLFHVHSFIFVSVVFAVWCVGSKSLKEGLKIFFPATVLAVPFIWTLTGGFTRASLIWWKPGWMIDGENVFTFFFVNFGLWIPILVWAAYMGWKTRNKIALFQLVPGVVSFFILFFVMFSPWEWDNVKLMVWAYFLVIPPVYELVLRQLRVPVRGLLVIALFFSGAISVISQYHHKFNSGFSIYSAAEVDGVCGALKTIPIGSRIAISQTFNHPVMLCGHPVVAGFKGHLWSHGIDSGGTEKLLRDLMMGNSERIPAEDSLDVKYIFWGNREQKDFEKSTRPWEKTKVKVAEGVWGAIYEM